jgi:hypothetical protein
MPGGRFLPTGRPAVGEGGARQRALEIAAERVLGLTAERGTGYA